MHAILLSAIFAVPQVLWVGNPSVDVELTPDEKTLVGTAVNNAFAVPAAKVVKEGCHQNLRDRYGTALALVWACTVYGETTLTDVGYFDADLAGELVDPKATTKVKQKTTPPTGLTAAQQTDHGAILVAVFAESMATVYSFEIWRDEEIASKIWAKIQPIIQGTEAEYRAAREAGLVALPIGRVP
jgi:hypothetical protein